MTGKIPRVLLLAHDLTDSTIAKRARMIELGGGEVTLAGFTRSDNFRQRNLEHKIQTLGVTRNGGFLHRAISVIKIVAQDRLKVLPPPEIIIARNLEMLAIAVAYAGKQKIVPTIVYEVLDLHRLMLRRDLIGRALRYLERALLRHAQAIITSSPSYISEYFSKINPSRLPVRLVENKVLMPDTQAASSPEPLAAGRPWVIGWFGIIRCKKSLCLLTDAALAHPGLLKVVIRGRPALDQIPDFFDIIENVPNITFEGPYTNPADLSWIYGSVHFSWAIDLYEEGLNSQWLLPNRLYEGGYYGCVPIALETVETGHYLKKRGIGLLLKEASESALELALAPLNEIEYELLKDGVTSQSRAEWAYDNEDCINLTDFLAGLQPRTDIRR